MTTPGEVENEPNSGYSRLETQIAWYDRKSGQAQRWFKGVKIVEFITSAAVPIAAFLSTPLLTALIGTVAVLLEGIQQLFQWQHNWITYRSTCEAVRHEKYSYIGRSASYDGLDDTSAKKALVERVESLISTEHSKWISRQEYELSKIAKKASAGDAGARKQTSSKETGDG